MTNVRRRPAVPAQSSDKRVKAVANAKERADPASADFALADSPLYLLVRAAGHYELAMENALRKINMDLPSWRALLIAHERSPSSVSEIAERSVRKLSTATRVVQRLESDGLVRLAQRESDARVTDVYITPSGERAATMVRGVASRIYAAALGERSPAEIKSLNRFLICICNNLEDGNRRGS
jgi:DNA-binding MarR family transcriptional regulator